MAGRKILVVEDEPDIRKLVHYNLVQERLQTVEAEDGEKALRMLDREKPDLIILDLMLPGLSDLTFASSYTIISCRSGCRPSKPRTAKRRCGCSIAKSRISSFSISCFRAFQI